MKPYASRTQTDMQDVLMNPNATGPETHYYMIRGGVDKNNITVLEPGTIGGEYIKTYGHYHVLDFDEQYTILSGEGIVIFQTRRINPETNLLINGDIDSFRAIRVKAGDAVHIPRRSGHLMLNIGKSWLVTVDNSPVHFGDTDPISHPSHADYEPFKKLHGAAYYVVEENGQPTLKKNPLYTNVPDATIE